MFNDMVSIGNGGGGATLTSFECHLDDQTSAGSSTVTREYTITSKCAVVSFFGGGTYANGYLNDVKVCGDGINPQPQTEDCFAVVPSTHQCYAQFSNLKTGDVVKLQCGWGELKSVCVQFD